MAAGCEAIVTHNIRDFAQAQRFVAEKMSTLLTEEYLEERARRADPAAVDRILAQAPDVPPVPGDE